MKKTRYIFMLILILASLILSACGADASQDAQEPTDEQSSGQTVDEAPADAPTEAPAEAPADTSQDPGAAVPSGNLTADLGFRPESNGFKFENYGENPGIANLTPVEVRRMFGDKVCASLRDDQCILIPPADEWMKQMNAGMKGGHCEGFAALSLLMYSGQVDPQNFGGSTASDLSLEGNEPLQREIAYWFTTQATEPARDAIIRGTPAEIVAKLQEAYAAGASSQETYAVGIYKPDRSGGHAVTAYGVQDQGNGVFWIMIYDNNYPGQERHIEVDTNANTWQYEAAINPSVEPDLYTGDASTMTLEIVPTSSRLGEQVCSFCASTATGKANGLASPAQQTVGVNNIGASPAQQTNQVWTEGDAAFLITDDSGRKLGYEGNTFVNQIPEAKVTNLRGDSLAQQDVPPTYELPVGLGFSLLVDGDSIKNKEDNSTDAVMIGPGYYIGVEGIYMDPGQKDILKMAGDGKSISYKTDYSESPTIVVGLERPAADFELALQGTDIKPGSETIVQFDSEKGMLVLRSTSDEAGKYFLTMTRIDDNGEESFETEDSGIELQPGDIIYFNVANWDGQGKSLEIQFDDGGDGTIDETVNMADKN